jgi:Zn-finger nucleic acid-binding protein
MQMTCPKCHGEMRVYERSGVTVDQCTECRGIFLDRGELEKLFEAEANWNSQHTSGARPQQGAYVPPPPPPAAPHGGGYAPPQAPYGAPGYPATPAYGQHGPQYGHHGHYRQHGHYNRKRRKGGFLGELFD